MFDELKVAISEVRNGVKVTGDLQMGDGSMTHG